MSLSKTDRDFYINTGIKVGVTIIGLYTGKQVLDYIIDNVTGGDEEPPPPVEVEETNIPEGWTAKSLADLIHSQVEGWNVFYYPETMEKLDELNDDQLKLLYNTYRASYKKSLTASLDGEYTFDKWGIETAYGRAVKRLEKLGMY